MIRREREDQGVIGIALSAAVGFASGLAAGMIVGEMLGDVHADRVRRALGRLRKKPAAPISPDRVIAAVQDALREHDTTRDLDITVHSSGAGLVELTGMAPDAVARHTAGEIARDVPEADVVVNRILVIGSDLPPEPIASSPGRA